MIKPPEYIDAITPYLPGKPIEELERELGIRGSVKLASNENPLGPSKLALAAIGDTLKGLNRYPDGGGYYLTEALSKKMGVPPEQIILGNGSNELIDILVKTFMLPGDDAVMAWPSFVVYPMAVQAQGANAIKVPLVDFKHDLSAMAEAVTKKTKLLFIANPNNPTGTIITHNELAALLGRIDEDVLVVLDEAYYEYVEHPEYPRSLELMKAHRNLIVLRTFSKIYGLAGLRIGYGVGDAGVVSQMNKIREPFNTNSPAQAAALAALGDSGHIEASRQMNSEGRAMLYDALKTMGIRYVPTEANFIFIFPGAPAGELYAEMLKRGVIVRPMGEEVIRVTIGLKEEIKAFLAAFRDSLGALASQEA